MATKKAKKASGKLRKSKKLGEVKPLRRSGPGDEGPEE